MSDALKRWSKMQQKRDASGNRKPTQSVEERRALQKIRIEARRAGAKLTTAGKGGLPPSLVLHVFRRDEWKCKSCGGAGQNGGLQLHHSGGIVASKWLSRMGHKNDPKNIVTICASCHDKLHEKARELGVDSSQVTPLGDVGTSRDHGKPVLD